jgi:hypothetical protein
MANAKPFEFLPALSGDGAGNRHGHHKQPLAREIMAVTGGARSSGRAVGGASTTMPRPAPTSTGVPEPAHATDRSKRFQAGKAAEHFIGGNNANKSAAITRNARKTTMMSSSLTLDRAGAQPPTPQRRGGSGGGAGPRVHQNDVRKGLLSCVERGLLPHSFDLSDAMAGPGASAPVGVSAAPLHKHVDQFKRQDVLTTDLGLSGVMNVKLDHAAVHALNPAGPPPAKKAAPATPKKLLTPPPATPDAAAAGGGGADDDDDPGKERDDPRTYAELLDMYSLHEFIIRKGATLQNTPEYQSYRRSHAHEWGAVAHVVRLLEELLASYGVPLAYIDGKKVATLAAVDLGTPSREELLHCIANRADVESLMVSSVQQFRQGKSGRDVAATRIQSVVRMHLQRKSFSHLRAATKASLLIQRQWGVHKGHMTTRKTLAMLREAQVTRWRETMARFVDDWPRLKNLRRIVVHVPSLSYAPFQCSQVQLFAQLQRAQLPRLVDLADDKVEIVLLSPIKFDAEAMQYYYSMLAASGVRSPESRVMVLVPENMARMPKNTGLTKGMLCSARLMKCLAAVVRGKTAFIVPGVVSNEELMLASALNLPMLCPEPRVAQVLSTKSGSKAVFEAGDVVTPVGAHNVRSEAELWSVLSRLVAEYPEYPRWLVKLDAEFGGRGTAILDVRRLRALEDAHDGEPAADAAERIAAELADAGGKRIKLLNAQAYPDWAAFSQMIGVMACCVEAVPTDILGSPVANMIIEPDGTTRLLSVQQQVMSTQYTVAGASHPQTCAPFEALRDAAMSVAAAAYRKKIIGYVSVDFVVYRKQGNVRLWAVDLELRLTNNAMMHSMAMLATGSQYDHGTGQCHVPSRSTAGAFDSPLCYVYTGVLYHPYISALRHSVFFGMCRQRGICYDIQARTGVLFHLLDVLLCNCVGVLCIGATEAQFTALQVDALDFIAAQLSAANATMDENTTNVPAIMSSARNMSQKVMVERKHERRR